MEFEIWDGLVAYGDPRLLRVALENLLSNAWKFTSGHPAARIEIGAAPCEGGCAFYVRDDGAVFDPSWADELFHPFRRLHGESEFEGTGVGLATVERIVRRHGGRAWAEGTVEEGATFYFTLGPSTIGGPIGTMVAPRIKRAGRGRDRHDLSTEVGLPDHCVMASSHPRQGNVRA